jgi:hypothetical protein
MPTMHSLDILVFNKARVDDKVPYLPEEISLYRLISPGHGDSHARHTRNMDDTHHVEVPFIGVLPPFVPLACIDVHCHDTDDA